jgi:nicotinate-nucleotide adenylyltransferase
VRPAGSKIQNLKDNKPLISTSGTSGKAPQSTIGNPKFLRLGLFGGAFNPIHFGHLRSGMEIQEAFSLNRVLFIPTAVPPHKETRNLLPFAHRLKMIRLAIDGHPFLKVSDVEKKREGKSYSIQTVRFFKNNLDFRAQLFFIIGIDAFLEIETWREYRNLFKLCHFVVMDRPGYRRDRIKEFIFKKISSDVIFFPGENRFLHPGGYSIYLFPITLMDISSTRIRQLRQRDQTIRYLLPEKVEDYILERNFYAA